MITCQHARHLFDRNLDGELSPSLQAELHAHQLKCPECQSELAMFEACGAVVALDVEDGGVLALYSSPTFDPNQFIGGIGQVEWAALNTDPNRPLFHRAVQGL